MVLAQCHSRDVGGRAVPGCVSEQVTAVRVAPRQMCGFPGTDDSELEVDVIRFDITASSQAG